MIFHQVKQYYSENEYPALAHQAKRWAEEKPLAGLRILDTTPVFRNTVLKYNALTEAGAELSVGVSDVMPCDKSIVEALREAGIPLLDARKDTPLPQDVVLDCAGAFASWPAHLGVSELTRSGAHVYAHTDRRVFLADEGRIKRIETCLGTGDGYIRAMAQLGYSHWQGKKVAVFGSGKVGTGIIYQLAKNGALVDVVTEPTTLSSLVQGFIHQCVDYKDVVAVAAVLQDAYAIVTATGYAGVVEKYGITDRILASGALLANMGVEDEFGATFPKDSVLNDKRPLNFILEEPTQLKYIDATMALHNEGALYLLKNALSESSGASGIITPPASIENEILAITRQNGLIADELAII